MIPPGIPSRQWSALQHAKASGVDVRVRQLAAQWIAVVDGEVVHINDAAKVAHDAMARRRSEVT